MKALGRHAWDSPDAWRALRPGRVLYQEWAKYGFGQRDERRLDNYERWLWQREAQPDGNGVATYHQETPVAYSSTACSALMAWPRSVRCWWRSRARPS